MKNIVVLFLIGISLFGCQKKTETNVDAVTQVVQDSLIRTIHAKWKFKVAIANATVSTKLSNWEAWRNYVNELTIVPNPSLSALKHKAGNLVEKTAVLRTSIPEFYNKQEAKARVSLLETNIQNLDMQLELEPMHLKEILRLLEAIQKNTNSLIYQFEEFEVKAKIPKEVGEDQLRQPLDTIKRATLNAILQE
ncbi:MAG TPA: hypothetical protein VLY87_00670 [Flavobacterium sp.]|nr:hypothetical protein [Flavobacterium sp.]